MPKIVVFLGPSLPRQKAKEILDADYRSPAMRGDIYKAAQEGAEIICLIDGVFFQECSVAHKEILYAMERGANVLGASSMGALRASELNVYGMEGIGEIYRAYKNGDLISDDEVALIFDPITFEPLSEPLVNIRHNLDKAFDLGLIDRPTKNILFEIAKSTYFPDRNYDSIIQACIGLVSPQELESFRKFLRNYKEDLKMDDAIRALYRARELADEYEG
ncbi:MAG: TfuA-related McrA-glycine thioamidation protein [Methanotrichaceae archaeon]|nr:TfuA-related McrA-glycine thioamidation protein [Methanotrichaceae archaeon]